MGITGIGMHPPCTDIQQFFAREKYRHNLKIPGIIRSKATTANHVLFENIILQHVSQIVTTRSDLLLEMYKKRLTTDGFRPDPQRELRSTAIPETHSLNLREPLGDRDATLRHDRQGRKLMATNGQ